MNGVQLITQSEYARRRGVAKSAVTKAVKENRITLINGMVDPTVADIQWARNTRARADAGMATQATTGEPAPAPVAAPTPAADSGYSVDRARREKAEADMAEIKLAEQRGELVRAVEVRAEIAKRAGQVRANLLQIPARLAPLLAGEIDQAKVHTLLDSEIRGVLTNLTEGD